MADVMQVSNENQWFDEGDEGNAPDSVLLTLVQSYDWAGTLARIASHPEEARSVGVQGRKPLHVACDHDAPAVVVAALLKVFAEASTMVGTSNMNPLHITCSSQHASLHVIRVLLEGGLIQQTQMRDVDGDTPLHNACRCGAPIEVLEILLRAYPDAVNQRDYEGMTPLVRLWVRYFVILGNDVIQNFKGPNDMTGELGEAWSKTELLLRCAYHGPLPPEGTDLPPFSVVHAAAAVDCPRPVVRIATIIYPHQVMEQDKEGCTPLMVAAKSPIYKVRDLSDAGYMLEDQIHGDVTPDYDNILEDEDTSGQPSVIDILLEASTQAARIRDSSGRLPVHLALKTGKRWNQGVKELIRCYPEGLHVPGPSTKLVPFQLAAWGTKTDLNTLFECVREHPSMLSSVNLDKLC